MLIGYCRSDPVEYKWRKQMFIVVFIHLVLWAICWIFAYAVRVRKVTPTHHDLPAPGTAGNGATTTTTGNNTAAHSRFIGAENAERVARMTFILALASTFMVSDLPYNNSRATAGLLWAFMALSVIHVAAVIFTRHAYFPLGFGILTFAIPIVIFALAFRSTALPYNAMV
ncbi:hypothetical protein HKX48_002518 [Thoreauomyces humboldtii]|nr:hypothetical protein HKX48_002518 [Thoreauomyces humboldtii]